MSLTLQIGSEENKMSLRDNFGNEYLDTYIPDKIVGFIGIDPDMKNGGGGGSGTDDHEQLTNLLGGDATGHWHVNAEQYHCLLDIMSGRLNSIIDARVAKYITDNNIGG